MGDNCTQMIQKEIKLWHEFKWEEIAMVVLEISLKTVGMMPTLSSLVAPVKTKLAS